MDHTPAFVREYLKIAEKLIEEGAVSGLTFSRGTYQFEVQEKGKKKAFPFIQMSDEGVVSDCFCNCKVSETGRGCPHLAASYLQIFNGQDEPLHVRYRKSLWSRLFQMESKRYDDLKRVKEGKYEQGSFSIEATNVKTKKRLKAILEERAVETEDNSIKFSNLPAEELAQYRAGNPSSQLAFELSFWSDLAKWLMGEEEYEIEFVGKGLPGEMIVKFPGLVIKVGDINWPWIIPSLASVKSPLKVHDGEDGAIESVVFDEERKAIVIRHRAKEESGKTGIQVGEWLFVEGKGFYRHRTDPFLDRDVIEREEIAKALDASAESLKAFLPINLEKRAPQYRLFFDAAENLHIEMDVSECFYPWAYVKGVGFQLLDETPFTEKVTIIPKSGVADFINRNRLWLQNFPGFQTHLGSLESHLAYRLKDNGDLMFEAELNFPQEYEEMHHFDEWVYIQGQGFYMKKESSRRLPLHPGLKVEKEAVSDFIDSHKEELEQVQGFFNQDSAVQKTGLQVTLNSDGLIAILPKMDYAPGIEHSQLRRFGNYFYIEGRGFSEIPPTSRLPERYQEPITIAASQEAAFLGYELEPLKPYIIDIDPRLVKHERLELLVKRILPARKKKGQQWMVDLAYRTESGEVDIFTIWDALQEKKRHLFSKAGLLHLKEPRFLWIKNLQKKRLDRERGLIRLSTMEWIRLTIFESIVTTDKKVAATIDEIGKLEPNRLPDISGLKATLRPYQEQGVQWLWHLYCHGLSGLLCDDMGLGKTHQTMALLAAVRQEDEEKSNKYLVVCPTSVIYHWQELLKRFLPEMRVCTYYGLERSLENFEQDYDLLLTSYGILRTGKNILKTHQFEVAVFDEIQIAKNHTSQTHKALRAIKAQMKLGLTGTPIENRIRELKSLIDIALPSYLPPDPIFRELFINPIEKEQDDKQKELLGKLVKPFILRRKKSEVLTDLPEKIEEIAYCDLSNEQKALYREVAFQMKGTVYQELKDPNKPVSFVHVFSALSTLKQICDHPALKLGDIKNYRSHESGKWDLFIELLDEARDSGQKVVVFSQYLDMLAIIEAHLKKKGVGYASIKGSTRDRAGQLKKFRDDPECVVFVASLLAAGVGIDLTVASIVIHYDRWWNPAKENQATDRVHRIGQNRGVQVFKLVTKHTIEEHIHDMIERKKGLLESIIGFDDQINYLSRDELLQVFEKMFKEINE